MSQVSTSPVLKRILIAVAGVTILGAVLLYLLATYPAGECRVAQELQARGFIVEYDRQDRTIWQRPDYVEGDGLTITPDDCRLIFQLPYLKWLLFWGCDMSGLNLDEIGNCPNLMQFSCRDVTQFPVDEIRKLAASSVSCITLSNADLKDSDLEHFAGLTNYTSLYLEGNAGITDAGLEHLEKIPALGELHLSKTSVTEEGVEEFRKKRTDVEVLLSTCDCCAGLE